MCFPSPGSSLVKKWVRKYIFSVFTGYRNKSKVSENEKCYGNTSHRQVFPQLFRVLQNVFECFCNRIETGRKYLLLPLEKLREKELLFISSYCYSLTGGNSVLYATVVLLSCIVFVLLVVIGVFIWRLRRALPKNRATTADKSIKGQSVSPRDQQMPEPDSYMELSPRPFEGQPPGPSVYKSLQGKDKNDEYYNVEFKDGKDEQEEIYHEIGNAQCWVVSCAALFICSSRFLLSPSLNWRLPCRPFDFENWGILVYVSAFSWYSSLNISRATLNCCVGNKEHILGVAVYLLVKEYLDNSYLDETPFKNMSSCSFIRHI